MARVTMADVAREAGVTSGTVSNALNHPERVKPATREAVQRAIAKLGYTPNQSARLLAGGGDATFGLVLPRLDHCFSLQVANGVDDAARDLGFKALIASAGNNAILTDEYMSYFVGTQVDGLLVEPMASDGWRPPAQRIETPTVYLDVHSDAPGWFIAADNVAQGEVIARHALERGARRIAVIGRVTFIQMGLRVDGVWKALAQTGGAALEVVNEGGWNSIDDGRRIAAELAARDAATRPDFIIGLTDTLAVGAIQGVLDTGLTVPGDIAVAGTDGNPLAWNNTMSLTTCASPGYRIGYRGVEVLAGRLDGSIAADGLCHMEVIDAPVMVRESTVGRG